MKESGLWPNENWPTVAPELAKAFLCYKHVDKTVFEEAEKAFA
jgi:hypothetical protein